MKKFPNLIDKYALSDKKIEEQEELFQRNKYNNQNSTKNLKKEKFERAETESTEETEHPQRCKYKKELDELKLRLNNLKNFQPFVEHFNQPGIYTFLQKMLFFIPLQYVCVMLYLVLSQDYQ